jgi:hypothetical protein
LIIAFYRRFDHTPEKHHCEWRRKIKRPVFYNFQFQFGETFRVQMAQKPVYRSGDVRFPNNYSKFHFGAY